MRMLALMAAATLAGLAAPGPAAADGGRVAFEPHGDVAVIDDAFAGAPTIVARAAQEPAWSPDGTRLAFSQGRPDQRIVVAAADGAGARVLADPGPGVDDREPAWTPDGDGLVFTRDRRGAVALWTMGADGSAPRRLVPGARHARFVAGGARLLFERDDALWAAHPDGGAPRRVAVGTTASSLLALADGTGYVDDDDRGIFEVRPAAAGPLVRVPRTSGRSPLAVAPDGVRLLATHSGRGNTRALGTDLVDLTGAQPPRQVAGVDADGVPLLGFRGMGGPAWWSPPEAAPVAAPARDVRAPVVLMFPVEGAARVLPAAGARRPVFVVPSLESVQLLTVDASGVRRVQVRWTPGPRRWRDVTGGEDAVAGTVPRRAGTYRLAVRAVDVLGRATTRPRVAIVKLR